MDQGLILDPSDDLTIDCYPDVDFAGLWGIGASTGPSFRTGYIIMLAGCSILWKSKFQTEIILSTIEVEYVVLSTAYCDLFPIMDLVQEIGKHFGLPVQDKSCFHVRVQEDNVSTLLLGQLEQHLDCPFKTSHAFTFAYKRT
ncbi:hypothetical protein ACHAWF_002161, partial [Thalassiosira exigua]